MPRTKLIESVLRKLPAAKENDASFSKAFLRKLPEEDIKGQSARDLSLVVSDLLLLKKRHKEGEIKVDVKLRLTEKSGKPRSYTIICVVCDDMAFTINSIVSELTHRGYQMSHFFHPRIQDEDLKAEQCEKSKQKDNKKSPAKKHDMPKRHGISYIHIAIDEILTEDERNALGSEISRILEDVKLSNVHWPDMLDVLYKTKSEIKKNKGKWPKKAIDEHEAFLDYLYNDNFTLLGSCEFDLSQKNPEPVNGLGLLSSNRDKPYLDFKKEGLPFWANKGNTKSTPLIVSKLKKQANVHRIVQLDAVSVVFYSSKGKAVKERVFFGLFTSVTYSRSIRDVPYIRQKADIVVRQSGFREGGHDYKALRHILEKFPRDELFQIETEQLSQTAMSIMHLQQQPHIALFTRNNPYNNLFSCLVYVPREFFDTGLRLKIQSVLEKELKGKVIDFYTTMDDSALTRVLFILSTQKQIDKSWDLENIEKKLQKNCRPWSDQFADEANQSYSDQEYSSYIIHKYKDAFPGEYHERIKPKHALYDVKKIEEAFESTGGMSFDLYRATGQSSNQLRLKIYRTQKVIPLSDILPVLENLGLHVKGERPYEVKVNKGGAVKSVWIHDFLMEMSGTKDKFDLPSIKPQVEEALSEIWFGRCENDSLNKLILIAGMNWREVAILRAYVHYLQQIRYVFSLGYMKKSLTENPEISAQIVTFFKAWHDPYDPSKNKEKAAGARVALDHAFDRVESLDYDRILRKITELVEATLRTNFFQTDNQDRPKTYLSLKLDSHRIKDIPTPRPFREIFVYSPRVEGIHLRGDKIARGGIRWSDRPEDFRTEVLGLMKAQLVKNSIIVPMGAKGGFVVKSSINPSDRAAFHKEGVECYKVFISGLLDITDNLVDDKVIPPENIYRRDEDDPYLVVAADKGTATFSDIANEISESYDFWLGDAFASGGAAGYDHKKMGITARGAWESVKRHFMEINHNVQKKPFRVIGVGDMGGDVFGNGMLLSRQICLIAAFNHKHIFIDPDPDPEISWNERKRLFDEVLGWDAYDPGVLSKGGRIYHRSEKSLKLTEEIQKLLNTKEKTLTPTELMHLLLKTDTDLLWFGGIGTYIKSTQESHEDVGDKSNDNIRINAVDVKARVIGEGANLAVTQKARIEASVKGVRMNADFIDNSGGVDCSDHEVNIKILMNDLIKNKGLTLKQRNKFLSSMTDEVAELVLRNNYQQALAVSLMELQSFDNINAHRKFISELEQKGLFERDQVGFPDEEELARRHSQGKGLTRPELALLQAYAKLLFTSDLLESDIPDSMNMQSFLTRYFPGKIQNKYKKEIFEHSLRREIIATEIANGMINRMGPTFVQSTMVKTNSTSDMVAKAYIIIREAFDLRELWDHLEALDYKVPAMVQLKVMREISQLVERGITWFLTRLGRDPDIDTDIPRLQEGVRVLKSKGLKLVTTDLSQSIEYSCQTLIDDGMSAELAKEVSLLPILGAACDIVRISLQEKEKIEDVAMMYFKVGQHFSLDWLRAQARYMQVESRWVSEARDGLMEQLYTCQAGITSHVISDLKAMRDDVENFDQWVSYNNHQTLQIQSLINDLQRSSGIDLAMLIIAEQRLRSIYGG